MELRKKLLYVLILYWKGQERLAGNTVQDWLERGWSPSATFLFIAGHSRERLNFSRSQTRGQGIELKGESCRSKSPSQPIGESRLGDNETMESWPVVWLIDIC